MSAWVVMAAIGLFQTDGGCRLNPVYEIGSPLSEKAVIARGGLLQAGEDLYHSSKGSIPSKQARPEGDPERQEME